MKGVNPTGHDGTPNLVNFKKRTPEEMRELAKKGGKASAEKRQKEKSFKQALTWALDLPALRGNATVDELKKQFPTLDNYYAIAISLMARAVKDGDVKAFKEIRDTIGEMPEQKVKVNNEEPIEITIRTID